MPQAPRGVGSVEGVSPSPLGEGSVEGAVPLPRKYSYFIVEIPGTPRYSDSPQSGRRVGLADFS